LAPAESRQQKHEFHEWKSHSSAIRSAEGLAKHGGTKWCELPGIKLKGLPDSERMRDVLNIGFLLRMKQAEAQDLRLTTDELVYDFWCDVAQGVQRKPYRYGSPPTFKQNTIAYSFAEDLVLTGYQHMILMGWPPVFLSESVSDAHYRSLSGESYSLPIITVLHYIMWCNPYGSWWAPVQED
jgi:hypothetical protein